MVLEAVMICIDNSEYMRNGDYSPSRLLSQNEAVNRIADSVTNSNVESVVGLLSMAGKRVQTHVSVCRSVGALLKAMHEDVKCHGTCNLISSLKVAQLALKNRMSKNQAQRIIMFIGSPVTNTKKELTKIGKLLKKNNVSIDIINFGTENTSDDNNDNMEKLQALIDTVNSNDNCHLVSIPPGPGTLISKIMSSPIMGVAPGVAGMNNDVDLDEYGGIDPNLDPEMAMAIRMSMEEARARQEAERKTAIDESKSEVTAPSTTTNDITTNDTPNEPIGTNDDMMQIDDEEDMLLQQAIAMSMAENNDDENVNVPVDNTPQQEEIPQDNNNDNDAMNVDEDISEALNDPDFIASLLDSAGVDKDEMKMDDIFGTNDNDDKDKKKQKKDDDKK